MNWLGVIAIALGLGMFLAGEHVAAKPITESGHAAILASAIILALPAFAYVAYYSRLLGREPIWLYRLRTIPGSELLGSLAGFLAGWVQVAIVPRLGLSEMGSSVLVPIALSFGLAIPYLKPIIRPLRKDRIKNQWRGAACLQTTTSTCGPASAATILKQLGMVASERSLAVQSFTSSSGTEIWYLARALRRRNIETAFVKSNPLEVTLPAIAGVRLPHHNKAGHFIALLSRQNNELVLCDPAMGIFTSTLAELENRYEFTGFFMPMRPKEFH